ANSRALELAGVTRATPDVAGGVIVRDPNGQPTGVLKDNAQGLVERAVPAPSPARIDSALSRAMAHAAEQGVTGVSYVSGTWPEINAFRRARDDGTLTLRVTAYMSIAGWRSAAESLRVNGPGDEWLRVAGVKAFVDGALGSTTAWFDEPYTDAPTTSGFPLGDLDTLASQMRQADSAGLQLAIHAIGTRANAWLLDQFAHIAEVNGPRDRRPRIEHAQHFRPADIPRVAALGVIPSMQPYHAVDDGRWAEKRIGPERIRTTYAFRSLLDAGALLAFGSDWTVAPLSPLLGVYAAVTRATIDGKQPDGFVPAEKIAVEEALRAYTAANAYATFAEQRTGVLRAGMKADLVVIDRDLTAVPAGQIRDAQVLRTLVGGRTVFRRP
ncbi:MAG TPA: amidohydrolase, partial [Gemmatimonadales bacterium]|nr:amidohydrolase [Gemmatimonadales bacterium]